MTLNRTPSNANKPNKIVERVIKVKAAVAQAQATYGEDWQAHCEWRVFRSYAKLYEGAVKPTDSICCRIVERGTHESLIRLNGYYKRLHDMQQL